MALTQVNINGISTKAYAKQMVEEFVALLEQANNGEIEFTGACKVDPASDNAKPEATATQLRKVIAEKELADVIKVRMEKGDILLIDATLV